MNIRFASSFERIAAHLDDTVAAARPRLEALGIAVVDASNRSGWDWLGGPPSWRCRFTREVDAGLVRARTTATVAYVAGSTPGLRGECEATWRAEAWRDSNVDVCDFKGLASVGLDRLASGGFERLVFSLLGRASTFPEELSASSKRLFPLLPDRQAPLDFLRRVKALHRSSIEPSYGPPVGCPEAEIDALEATLGWRLPLAYRQYLGFMGADRAGIFRGSGWFADSPTVDRVCPRLLGPNEIDYTPPGDTFEFMWHQGYMAGWFDVPTAHDDPPVFFYNEGASDQAVCEYVCFTDFLLAELEHHVTSAARFRKEGGIARRRDAA